LKPLFGFGFSQEDEGIVAAMLGCEGETVLCVASGGDIPLALVARGAEKVIGVDISEGQLRLCELKVAAVKRLSPEDAAALFGFLPASVAARRQWMAQCAEALSPAAAEFWQAHEAELCDAGAIWCGRYEQFILKLHWILRPLLGRAFRQLASCATLAEQEMVFDRRIGRQWLRSLLRMAFSRKVYEGHGVDKQGLANRRTEVPLGEQYWSKLRTFCTATLARHNPWLQMHTLGRVLSMEAAPVYLGEGFAMARAKADHVEWVQSDLLEYVRRQMPDGVTRVYLSNLPDWYSPADFGAVVAELARRLPVGARIGWSYLHSEWQIPDELSASVIALEDGASLSHADRFPFYTFNCVEVASPKSRGGSRELSDGV
jgi:S-adenosylmethionine-diacylglycerol 3-amino-3-carboxypropyl transferase